MLIVGKIKLHIGAISLAVALIIAGVLWQGLYSREQGRVASGSSLPGLVIGSVAAAIIAFELLLWPRKRLRRLKLFRTKYWLAAHLWLGLATGPLAFVHAGYRFGGTFSTTLMWLLIFVLASGVFGWVLQVLIPKWMLRNLPYETIASQIPDVSVQNALQARQILTAAFGTKPEGLRKLADLESLAEKLKEGGTRFSKEGQLSEIVVGAVQRRGPLRAPLSEIVTSDLGQSNGREIWKEYASTIEPFLLRDIAVNAALQNTNSAKPQAFVSKHKLDHWFEAFRLRCSEESRAIVDRLYHYCLQRLQHDMQKKALRWLHGWIAIHAGVSVMLGVLLLAHIVLALRYL